MKSGIIIVFVAVTAFAFAIPAIEDAKGGSDYFKKKLHEIQGAIDDTIKAGMDLEDMEDRLQDIVNLSSFFFRTESATEYATDKNAYANGWTGPVDDDKRIYEVAGYDAENCAALKSGGFCLKPYTVWEGKPYASKNHELLGRAICPASCEGVVGKSSGESCDEDYECIELCHPLMKICD